MDRCEHCGAELDRKTVPSGGMTGDRPAPQPIARHLFEDVDDDDPREVAGPEDP